MSLQWLNEFSEFKELQTELWNIHTAILRLIYESLLKDNFHSIFICILNDYKCTALMLFTKHIVNTYPSDFLKSHYTFIFP